MGLRRSRLLPAVWGAAVCLALAGPPSSAQPPENGPPPSLEKARQERVRNITARRDALIASTLAAYGGRYRRTGDKAWITVGGKTYADFEIRIVRGQFLFLRLPDGVLQLEIVAENP